MVLAFIIVVLLSGNRVENSSLSWVKFMKLKLAAVSASISKRASAARTVRGVRKGRCGPFVINSSRSAGFG